MSTMTDGSSQQTGPSNAVPNCHAPARCAATDERALVEACKTGDRSAWDDLIRRYERPVYRFAYSLSHNYDDASDISAQVFVRLYQNIDSFRNDSHFASWLFCIVRNVYVDTCIRAPHRSHVSLEAAVGVDGDVMARDIVDPAPSPEERSLFRERRDLLRRAIGHLPQYQRSIMQLYHGEGRSYEEIAALTGLSLGTIKSRLARARHMLRERLDPMQEVLLAA